MAQEPGFAFSLRGGSCNGRDHPHDHDVGGLLPKSGAQFRWADPAEASNLPGSTMVIGAKGLSSRTPQKSLCVQ
jgi:hypothetical protein